MTPSSRRFFWRASRSWSNKGTSSGKRPGCLQNGHFLGSKSTALHNMFQIIYWIIFWSLTSLDVSDVDTVWTWGGQTSPPHKKNRKNSSPPWPNWLKIKNVKHFRTFFGKIWWLILYDLYYYIGIFNFLQNGGNFGIKFGLVWYCSFRNFYRTTEVTLGIKIGLKSKRISGVLYRYGGLGRL